MKKKLPGPSVIYATPTPGAEGRWDIWPSGRCGDREGAIALSPGWYSELDNRGTSWETDGSRCLKWGKKESAETTEAVTVGAGANSLGLLYIPKAQLVAIAGDGYVLESRGSLGGTEIELWSKRAFAREIMTRAVNRLYNALGDVQRLAERVRQDVLEDRSRGHVGWDACAPFWAWADAPTEAPGFDHLFAAIGAAKQVNEANRLSERMSAEAESAERMAEELSGIEATQ